MPTHSTIFISYRIDDSNDLVGRMDDYLRAQFGDATVFRDKRRLLAGQEWSDELERNVRNCAVILVVIGPSWEHATFRDGRHKGFPRLSDPEDWVRKEITVALQSGCTVIPVRANREDLPDRAWLENVGLAGLAGKQSVRVRSDEFQRDMTDLMGRLRQILAAATHPWASNAGAAAPARPDDPNREETVHAPRFRGADLAQASPSRSPVIIALESERYPLQNELLPRIERHLTLVLSDENVDTLGATGERIKGATDLETLVEAGEAAWRVLLSASPRLAMLLERIASSEIPQPVCWTGRVELLLRVEAALLAARSGASQDADGLVSVASPGHYLQPVEARESRWDMRPRRSRDRPPRLVQARVDDEDPRTAVSKATHGEIALCFGAQLTSFVEELATKGLDAPGAWTRALIAFGSLAVSPELLHLTLMRLPCVSIGPMSLAQPALVKSLERNLPSFAPTQALPIAIGAIRSEWLRDAWSSGDIEAIRCGLAWTTWSRVGLPLFAKGFGAVKSAATPHLTHLRSVLSEEWYFDRDRVLPKDYLPDNLTDTRTAPEKRFHLYVSGAGGTGKSCFIHSLFARFNQPDSRALPIWYRVDAPGSEWDTISARIVEEAHAAVSAAPELCHARDQLLPSKGNLGPFLREFASRLRAGGHSRSEVVVFIDQLERTFESGDQPDPQRLEEISTAMLEMLENEVSVADGVRFIIASRKQYLADFLHSSQHANTSNLQFVILPPFKEPAENRGFIKRVLTWCHRPAQLLDKPVAFDDEAANLLVKRSDGNPLNMMLSLIHLLSHDLPQRVTLDELERRAPWEERFSFDIQIMSRDDIDWYFLLAMAHAQTEIVQFQQIWWRLRMVEPTLTRDVESLGEDGVKERLWLRGHLGRTIVTRPGKDEPAEYMEFFHANLRDYLLSQVMSSAGEGGGNTKRRGGTPDAWRALDRLAAAAHEWAQGQQLLNEADLRVLMEHRETVLEPRSTEGPKRIFGLLFVRATKASREKLSEAAQECYVYSALVHDDHSRLAFERVFPEVQDRIRVIKKWLPRCRGRSRQRVLRYLVGLEEVGARDFLSSLILRGSRESSPDFGPEIAGVLADEPLYAARFGPAVVEALFQRVHKVSDGAWQYDETLLDGVGRFAVAVCGENVHTLNQLLLDSAKLISASGKYALRPALEKLRDGTLAQRWLRPGNIAAQGTASSLRLAAAESMPATVELIVGEALTGLATKAKAREWHQRLEEEFGLLLPEIRLSSREISRHELELRICGAGVGSDHFYPDRVQVQQRHLPPDFPVHAVDVPDGEDESVGELVLWLKREDVTVADRTIVHRDAQSSVFHWLRDKLRTNFDEVYETQYLVGLISKTEDDADWGRVLQSLTLQGLRGLFVELIEERVPLGRVGDLLRILQSLAGREANPHKVAQLIREHPSTATALCREFADHRGQLLVILLDEELENALIPRAPEKTPGPLPLDPGSALELSGAVRRAMSLCLAEHDALPVIVCDTELRFSLYKTLQSYSRAFHVLSYDELSTDIPAIPVGLIRRVEVPSLEG
jgi:hypothetical protein